MSANLLFQPLLEEAERPEWSRWREILRHAALLHEICILPPIPPSPYPVESIGPGYCYNVAFGHWDLIFQLLDSCPVLPEHTKRQLLNQFVFHRPDGFMQGVMHLEHNLEVHCSPISSFPPLWPVAVDCHAETTGSLELTELAVKPLLRQIQWFENDRRADGGGFFYNDVLHGCWESGIDESLQAKLIKERGKFPCLDATSHMRLLYDAARRCLRKLNRPGAEEFDEKCAELDAFIQNRCFCDETGFFHDPFLIERKLLYRTLSSIWPLFCGAATPEQAASVVKQLMMPEKFLTAHPLPYIAVDEPLFELRMWRGPAWNSITYCAMLGCERYGFYAEAAQIAERVLDDTLLQHRRTGALWEFYDPNSGEQHKLFRKQGSYSVPCREYLGHNPLFAIARLYLRCKAKGK